MGGTQEMGENPWLSETDLNRLAEGMSGDSSRSRASFRAILATVGELLGEPDIDVLLRRVVDHTMSFCVDCHTQNQASDECLTCHY